MKRTGTVIVIFCLYIAAVLYLCLMKPDDIPQVDITFFDIPLDKISHFLMFLPFPILSYLLFYEKAGKVRGEILILALITVVGIAMAIATELLQSLIGYRTPEVNDVYADMTGLGTGCVITIIMIIIKRKLRKR